ncbi:hypothetical protein [Yaravirus sp. 'brasiliensis']|uniref:Uncharacterized protein n=1 Tax=Yaravirus sp. 'brasiliensis' TaxID=2739681 RepID=A0AAE7B636_9VIRU|nr:hypothetical protein QKS73_gp44 [Yaravirus brasiliensis]QKE44433.1 hypothetical protein [Yaravirus brasiliensis]
MPEWSWNPFSNVDKGLTWEGVGQFLTQGPWDIPGHVREGIHDIFKDDDPPKNAPSGDSNRGGSTGDNSHQPPKPKTGGNGGRIQDNSSGSSNSKDSEMSQWFADNGPLLLGGAAVGLLLLAFVFRALRA